MVSGAVEVLDAPSRVRQRFVEGAQVEMDVGEIVGRDTTRLLSFQFLVERQRRVVLLALFGPAV